ncbi:MAG: multicopper oxidase domain-containing protein [Alphaproteobacteria bacterium]|nr:multicopper oxidase domain-containing protein [Alphaproteobacteria bacterium]
MKRLFKRPMARRDLLSRGAAIVGGSALAGLGVATGGALGTSTAFAASDTEDTAATGSAPQIDGGMSTIGNVGTEINGFDAAAMLTDWDTGVVSVDDDGNRVRSFVVEAIDKDIEIAPGVIFPAWTFNGRVPGPTIRVTEGEIVRILFRNLGSKEHSLHFHGIHSARMDGVPGTPGMIGPGEEFTYEFSAKPFGCHFYHCHALPLRHHMHKGMYGAFIIDPDPALHPEQADIARSRLLGSRQNRQWQELVMVMNGFDTNFDGANEFYAVNTVAHHFTKNPIPIDKSRPVRVYLINATEFDPINSFHLHGNFFDYYDHGTTLTPSSRIIDTVMQCQAQRGILEFSFADHEPGQYMFHAHQVEFTELGWMGFFDVRERSA